MTGKAGIPYNEDSDISALEGDVIVKGHFDSFWKIGQSIISIVLIGLCILELIRKKKIKLDLLRFLKGEIKGAYYCNR